MTSFKKYILISLIIAALNALMILFFFFPRFNHTDTAQYISTIKYFAGEPGGELVIYRFLKPMPILIGAALAPVLKAENTLIFQNLIFYFLSVWLVFLLVYRLYKNEKQALYGTILYIGAYPMLAYGLASLTDLPGWFFFLATVLLSLNFLKNPSFKTAASAGLIAGFGLLFKESVAAAPIFFVSLVFMATDFSFKEKIKYILVFGASFLLFPFVNSIIMYKLYAYSYLDWYGSNRVGDETRTTLYVISFFRIVIEIARVLLIGWVFVLFGVLKEFALKNIERLKILSAFILPSLSVFLWSYPHNRMLYIAFPLLVSLGSFGLLRNYKNPKINTLTELVLLFLYVFVNYAVLDFLLKYGPIIQPPGTLFG